MVVGLGEPQDRGRGAAHGLGVGHRGELPSKVAGPGLGVATRQDLLNQATSGVVGAGHHIGVPGGVAEVDPGGQAAVLDVAESVGAVVAVAVGPFAVTGRLRAAGGVVAGRGGVPGAVGAGQGTAPGVVAERLRHPATGGGGDRAGDRVVADGAADRGVISQRRAAGGFPAHIVVAGHARPGPGGGSLLQPGDRTTVVVAQGGLGRDRVAAGRIPRGLHHTGCRPIQAWTGNH